MKTIACWVMLLCLPACALWQPVGGPYISSDYHFEVELPQGWRRAGSTRQAVTLTRDGFPLQIIRIVRDPFDKEMQFTKRKLARDMLPEEAAGIVIDNLRSNPGISNVRILENVPVNVGGRAGFKLVYSFQAKNNLRKQGIYYGAVVDQWHYYLYFEAPSQHYFARDRIVFEQIVKTFKITL
jgi:hypothetical protein